MALMSSLVSTLVNRFDRGSFDMMQNAIMSSSSAQFTKYILISNCTTPTQPQPPPSRLVSLVSRLSPVSQVKHLLKIKQNTVNIHSNITILKV